VSRHAERTTTTPRSRTIRLTVTAVCGTAMVVAACGHAGGGSLITAKTRTELIPYSSAPIPAQTGSTAPIRTSRHKRTTPHATAHPAPVPAATAAPARRATPTKAPLPPPPGSAPPPTSGGGGRPGPSNTGVPAGTALTVHNGDLHITKAGTVLDAQDIRGFVFIEAANVSIKRSIIRGGPVNSGNIGLVNDTGGKGTNFVLSDSELTPANPSVYVDGIKGSNYTMTRVDIHGTVDGAKVFEGGNVTIQNSWLHDTIYYASDPNQGGGHSHNDGVQVLSGGNIRIIGNTITGANNAGMQVTQGQGAVSGLLFSGNWADGGGCTINVAPNPLASISGVTLTNNRFGRATRNPNCPMIATTSSHISASGNVWDDNGKPVTVRYA
jgi:hypothetical protein